MTVRAIALVAVLGVVALSGCGSSDSSGSADKGGTTIVGGADSKSVEVIKSWADELRAGDVAAASERFALPTVVQNGTPALTLTSRRQVEAFNRSLPCGASTNPMTMTCR